MFKAERETTQLSGVADLPFGARVMFAKALLAEARGRTAEADLYLTWAIAKEAEHA